MRSTLLIPLAASALFALGCGDSQPDPNDPSQMQGQYGAQGQYGQSYGQQPQGYGAPGQYVPPQQQQPQQGTPYGQPQPTPQPMPGTPQPAAQGGGQATPIAPAMAGAATPALTALAAGEVQGMQPDGSAFAAQFQEGQTLEQPINLAAGKCYSVVAAGLGIQELDVQIVLQPMPQLPAQVLAQDNSQGPNAVLGGKSAGCFRNPFPIGGTGKVIMRATRGAGVAMGQVYVK